MPVAKRTSDPTSDPTSDSYGVRFYCPGCKSMKVIPVEGPAAVHCFNGDFDKPTLTPSLLYQGFALRCHSYVTDGRIQYLSDCSHALVGQTIDLPELITEQEEF